MQFPKRNSKNISAQQTLLEKIIQGEPWGNKSSECSLLTVQNLFMMVTKFSHKSLPTT